MSENNNDLSAKSQLDKFKEAARQLECDEDEAAFEEKLKKIAAQEPAKDEADQKEGKPE
jgi:hypothetical protein